MLKPERILIVADSTSIEMDQFITDVSAVLDSSGLQSRFWSPASGELPQVDEDLIIVVGGDGSLMSLLRELDHPPIPCYGVNFGRVGFLMNPKQEPAALVSTLLGGRFVEQRLPDLEVDGWDPRPSCGNQRHRSGTRFWPDGSPRSLHR